MIKFYKLIVIPAMIIIVMGILAGFDVPGEDELAQKLINQRIHILEQAFYGKINEETAIKRLQAIETYPLYNRDVNAIKSMEETEIDTVRDAEFRSVVQTAKMFTFLTYTADIKWTMRGLTGDYQCMGRYSIVLKSENQKYKLSEFQLI